MKLQEIDSAILAAHDKGDGVRLAALYAQAGRRMVADGDIDEGCFFLTQAYVFALEHGLEDAERIHAELVSFGRDK